MFWTSVQCRNRMTDWLKMAFGPRPEAKGHLRILFATWPPASIKDLLFWWRWWFQEPLRMPTTRPDGDKKTDASLLKFFPQTRLARYRYRVLQMSSQEPRPHERRTLLCDSWVIKLSHVHLPGAGEFLSSMQAKLNHSIRLGYLFQLSKNYQLLTQWNKYFGIFYQLSWLDIVGCVTLRKRWRFQPSSPEFESWLRRDFFSLKLSLRTVLRSNPSIYNYWISCCDIQS